MTHMLWVTATTTTTTKPQSQYFWGWLWILNKITTVHMYFMLRLTAQDKILHMNLVELDVLNQCS